MAVLAGIRGRYVIQVFAGCVCAVVTTDAIPRDTCVIEICRHPGIGGVASIAVVTAAYMRWILACRNVVVVTGVASADDLRMVYHRGRLPDRCTVAILANVSGLNVSLVLAGRIDAVVTPVAAADDIGMIKDCRHPGIGGMTIITIVSAHKMRWVLACRHDIVMTRYTGAYDLSMVYRNRRLPERRTVTIFADICRLNV